MKSLKTTGILLVGALANASAATVPTELTSTLFAGPDKAPCPAVICAAPTGEVFVGVDLQGSLGKEANKGRIVRLVDTNNDGKADKVTNYATIDNPRGLISLGDKIIVLHCTQKDGKPHNQQISVFTDANNDGVADGPLKPLVKGIGNPKFVQSRGADHCTNNIRLGIDGWIYVSVGDFGFVGAEGTDGKKLTFHGGGIVRVRPDGSGLETFIHGTRNVYDVAIDPFMNVFTRENTNDGVGWWVRFSHYIQSGEFGYPSLYTNFPEDILPALGEYGRGSGTGSLFLQEPQWPAKYNNSALLADWGHSQVYIHRTKPDGASFTNTPEKFIGSKQVADLDVDASGRMYIAAWAGAGYKGNPSKGFVDRVVPKNWKYVPFPALSKQSEAKLIELLRSPSITVRTYASQELVARKAASAKKALINLAKDTSLSAESRVAAIYTIAQIEGAKALPDLKALASDTTLREHAIRCMADRLEVAKKADTAFLINALKDSNPRVQVAAAIALGRTGDKSIASKLLALSPLPANAGKVNAAQVAKAPSDNKSKKKGNQTPQPHSTPNKDIILPHVARQAVIALDAQQEVANAILKAKGAEFEGALQVAKWMHSEVVVKALIEKLKSGSSDIKPKIFAVLARLHQKENDYDGSTWWSTKPNPHGPYYYAVDWSGTPAVDGALKAYVESLSGEAQQAAINVLKRNKSYVDGFNQRPQGRAPKGKTFGKTAIEDIIIYLDKTKGSAKRGRKIIGKVACANCHNVDTKGAIKGPDLTKLGNMPKAEIAAAIKTPGATIAESWVSITMKDGSQKMGTLVKKTAKEIVLHDIAGVATKLDATKVTKTEAGPPMMGPGLCDSLTLQQAADLIEYIQSLDKNRKRK